MTKPVAGTNNQEYTFSKDEIESLVKTKEDFIDGKIIVRDWNDIEEDLNQIFG